jgi:hypothetical protein
MGNCTWTFGQPRSGDSAGELGAWALQCCIRSTASDPGPWTSSRCRPVRLGHEYLSLVGIGENSRAGKEQVVIVLVLCDVPQVGERGVVDMIIGELGRHIRSLEMRR